LAAEVVMLFGKRFMKYKFYTKPIISSLILIIMHKLMQILHHHHPDKDTSGEELSTSLSDELLHEVRTPIVHQKYWKDERVLYGYNPRFQPNPPTFDSQNRVYMLAFPQECNLELDDATTQGFVQTLDNGTWKKLPFHEQIAQHYPDWDGKFSSGAYTENRVIFTENDTAYLMIMTTRGTLKKLLLLESKDYCVTWKITELPYKFAITTPVSCTISAPYEY
jgi:hypothetical protein